jgi:hypothetical protein
MNLEITRNELGVRLMGALFGSLCAMDASKGPHRVQVKVQLLKEVCSLTHGARQACQTFRQVSVVLIFGLGHVLRVWVVIHFLGDQRQRQAVAH